MISISHYIWILKHYVVYLRASQVVLMVKILPVNEGNVRDMGLITGSGTSLGQKDPMKEGMATHSSTLAWKIPWTEEPGGLQSIGFESQTWLKKLGKHTCYIPETNIILYIKYILIFKMMLKNIIPISESKTTNGYNHFKSTFTTVSIADDKSSFLWRDNLCQYCSKISVCSSHLWQYQLFTTLEAVINYVLPATH